MIKIENLTKRYGNRIILQGLNLQVERGNCAAITGVNGCGKSTLLKIAGGVTRYEAGQVWCDKKTVIRYIPEYLPKLSVTPEQYLISLCAIEGIARDEARDRAGYLAERFHMQEHMDKPMKYLSKGTLQKTGVLQALISEADLLLMDEPLSGQDTASQAVFVEEIRIRKEKGTAVILACHEEWLARRLADQIYEIRDKRIHTVQKKIPAEEDCQLWGRGHA